MKKKEKDKLFDNLPDCAAEFIKLVLKKMCYRREVRQDVMAELTAHFEDELRDCKTNEEKEQKSQQLIEQFGDAKLLGVLLRRAKKRCRPLWRTIIARTFQTAGVLIVCLILYVAWFLTGKPIVTVDYVAELNRIVRPIADEALNAAPLYDKATGLYEKLPGNISELLRKKYNEVTPEEKQLIREWLIDNREILELVIAGSRKPYYWQRYSNKEEEYGMMGILLPHLSEFRKLVYSLRWRAWLQAEQGKYGGALDDILACYRLGQHLKGDKDLIEQLVGIAIESLAVRAIRDIVSEYQIDLAILAKLQEDFEKMIADENFAVSLKFERLRIYDEVQRCFTEDRFGGGHISLEGLKRFQMLAVGLSGANDFDLLEEFWTKSLHILFTHPNKQETREMADRYYAFWEKIGHKTPAQIRIEAIDTKKEAMEFVKGNILLEMLAPALGKVNELSHRNRTESQALLTVLALLRYKDDKGVYPEDLRELIVAGYLRKLPMDPFSDKPLVYKKTDSDFTLYSIGCNFKDDGGEVVITESGAVRRWDEEEGDAVFWPIQRN